MTKNPLIFVQLPNYVKKKHLLGCRLKKLLAKVIRFIFLPDFTQKNNTQGLPNNSLKIYGRASLCAC